MNARDDIIRLISDHAADLDQFGVKSLALFGSVARDEATGLSDVDVLVEFEEKARFLPFMGLRAFLEDLLDAHIDLATPDMIRPEIRDTVARDLIRVA